MEEFIVSLNNKLILFFLFANWFKNVYVLQSSFINREESGKNIFSN